MGMVGGAPDEVHHRHAGYGADFDIDRCDLRRGILGVDFGKLLHIAILTVRSYINCAAGAFAVGNTRPPYRPKPPRRKVGRR